MPRRGSPSGPISEVLLPGEWDWDTLPAGLTAIIAPLDIPSRFTSFYTAVGPFPPGVFGYALQANVEGVNAAILGVQNNNAGPTVVGKTSYEIEANLG